MSDRTPAETVAVIADALAKLSVALLGLSQQLQKDRSQEGEK